MPRFIRWTLIGSATLITVTLALAILATVRNPVSVALQNYLRKQDFMYEGLYELECSKRVAVSAKDTCVITLIRQDGKKYKHWPDLDSNPFRYSLHVVYSRNSEEILVSTNVQPEEISASVARAHLDKVLSESYRQARAVLDMEAEHAQAESAKKKSNVESYLDENRKLFEAE